ncbi:MAG: aminotransferase class IV [Polyangiaceae bacterium]
MSRVASINGKIVPLESAVIPVLDRGFLYADGVFETLRVYGGHPFAREEHMARLERSAATLRITLPVSLPELSRELDAAIDASAEPEAYVRIIVTRGPAAEPTLVPAQGLRATRVILVQPVRPPSADVYARGLAAITLAWGRGGEMGPAGGAKLLSYVTSILALEEARARGAEEAIFVTPEDNLCDASASNVFVVDASGRLVTPSEGPGVLGGITRGQVLDLACSLGLTCAIESVPRRSLADAQEVFLTSSVREIASIVRVDGTQVGAGVPGETARTIHRALRFRAGATGAAPWE